MMVVTCRASDEYFQSMSMGITRSSHDAQNDVRPKATDQGQGHLSEHVHHVLKPPSTIRFTVHESVECEK
jgi:hypothetical protein